MDKVRAAETEGGRRATRRGSEGVREKSGEAEDGGGEKERG